MWFCSSYSLSLRKSDNTSWISLTRDWAHAPCHGRAESSPLDCQGSPSHVDLNQSLKLSFRLQFSHVKDGQVARPSGCGNRFLQWHHNPFTLGSITAKKKLVRWWNSSWAISNPKRWCCESAALNMPANLENSAEATGLEKVSFHSNPKGKQCQRMLRLPHNCTHLTC